MSIILPPPPSKEDKVLSWLVEKYQNADPDKRRKFEDKIDVSSTPTTTEQEYFVDENSKEFGLTKEDYEFLLDDIEFQISEANRKYGNGEAGIVDRNGNFYPFTDTDKPRRIKKYKPKHKVFATAVIEKKVEEVDSNG